MSKLAELQEKFREKSAEHGALCAKGESLTDDDAGRLLALPSEMTEIREGIEREKALASARDAGKSHSDWGAQIPSGIPHPGANGNTEGGPPLRPGQLAYGGPMVLGVTRDGTAGVRDINGGAGLDYEFTDEAYRDPGAFDAFRTRDYHNAFFRRLQRRDLSADEARLLEKGADVKGGTLAPYGFVDRVDRWREYRDAPKQGLGLLPRNAHRFAMQESTDVDGGFLSPDQLMERLIQKLPTPTRVADYVTQLTTTRDALAIPKVNYISAADDSTGDIFTTGVRTTWGGETPAQNAVRATQPQFGEARIPIYTAMLALPITLDLLEDAIIDVQGWLSMKFGETIELLRDQMILNGNGVGQPMGILANPGGTNQPAVIVSGDASNVTSAGVIKLSEQIPEQYDGNFRYVFSKTTTGRDIRLLRDGVGRPLFGPSGGDNFPGYASGRPTELNGYPYIWSAFMPAPGASTYPMIGGDLTGYALVNRIGFSMRVLTEVLAEQNQVLLLGRVRFGGETIEPWRLRILQAHA